MGGTGSVHLSSMVLASATSGSTKRWRASSYGNASGSGVFFLASAASTPSIEPCSRISVSAVLGPMPLIVSA